MASINSSDHQLSASKRRLKPPLLLRDYLLDDLSSCSSNGFKSFPRRQCCSSTVRLLLDAEIKRSRLHHKRRISKTRTTCGAVFSNAVHKASTVFVSAVKLLPFHSSVKPSSSPTVRKRDIKQGVFSRSFSKRLLSRSFWRKSNDQGDSGELIRRVVSSLDAEIPRWKSFAEFLQESLDQRSDQISPVISREATFTTDDFTSGDFSSSSISRAVHSPWSGSESEASNETDAVGDAREVVTIKIGESAGAHVGDGSYVNRTSLCTEDSRKSNVSEEKEQFSPVSVLECPFEDEDENTSPPNSHINETNKKIGRKSRRSEGMAQLEPVDLQKRIEWYTENQNPNTKKISHQAYNKAEDEEEEEGEDDDDVEAEKRANDLFAIVKSRMEGPRTLEMCNAAGNLLSDFFQEDTEETVERERLAKTAEEWVLGRQEEMYVSWEVGEMREVYVREMERREKWGCFGEERESVADELGCLLFTSLVEELMLDLFLH